MTNNCLSLRGRRAGPRREGRCRGVLIPNQKEMGFLRKLKEKLKVTATQTAHKLLDLDKTREL